MKVDLFCPVEMWSYTLPKEDAPFYGLKLYNLGDRQVTSVEVTLIFFTDDGEETQRLIHRAHSLDGRPGSAFLMEIPAEEAVPCHHLETVIEKVWFDANSVWRRDRTALREVTSNALPNGRALENLRNVAGSDAVGYPEQQGDVWLCVCGRANSESSDRCVRCGRVLADLLTHCNQEAVEEKSRQREQQLNLKSKAALEANSQRQHMRESAWQEKKQKRRRVLVRISAVAVGVALAYGGVFHLMPYLAYQEAGKVLAAGNYGEAQVAYEKLGDYRDAPQLVTRCIYLAA